MKRSEFDKRLNEALSDRLDATWTDTAARVAEEAGVEWDPEVDLLPCPNPECVLDGGVELNRSTTGLWVACNDCSLSGPYSSANDEAEAIRLWNLLPRTQDEVPAGDPGEREGGELPERVELGTLNATSFSAVMLKWYRLGPKETMGWNEPEDRRVYAEARDCYNAVRRWERANPGSAHTIFGKILAEERER